MPGETPQTRPAAHDSDRALELVLSPRDQIVLLVSTQLDKVGRIAGDAHHQIVIGVRVLLRLAHVIRGDHVVLDLHAALVHVRLGKIPQLGAAVLAGERARMYPQVERHAVHELVVAVAVGRLQHGRGAVVVAALDGARAVGDGLVEVAAVGRGPGHVALRHVVGGAVEAGAEVLGALGVRVLADLVVGVGDPVVFHNN